MHKIHRRFIMKKIFALILVVLMLVPFVASCREPNNTDTNSTPATSDTNSDTSKDTSTDTNQEQKPADPNKKDVAEAMKAYKGQTINIMAAPWTNGEAGYPWSQVELCVSEWDQNGKGWGQKINNAVMTRQEEIEETYEVTLKWIDVKGNGSMLNRLVDAAMNKGLEQGSEVIHVALPHTFEAMEIVVQDALYTMGSDYINFDASYFSQESVENYTLAGNTFFAGGDISLLDEQASYVLFFNNAIAEEFSGFPDLYQAVLDGTWTIDMLYDLAGEVSENKDDKPDEYTDDDKYGLGTSQIDVYYQYFGVYQVGKGKNSSNQEVFILTIENEAVQTIIDKMLFAKNNPASIRTTWGGYGPMEAAFKDNRLLFYHEVTQKVFSFDNELKIGLLPFPKLTTGQDSYHVPFASQATVICIPRATTDRVLSECMVEILAKTGGEYVMPAYVDTIADSLHADYKEDSLRVLNEEIFPNLMYDIGFMKGRYGGDGAGLITSSVQSESIAGNTNNFSLALSQGRTTAEDTLAYWSQAYNVYED